MSRKGAAAIFTACGEKESGAYRNRATSWGKTISGTPDLYVPELRDFQEARLSLSEHEETFLSHSEFTNAEGGLDAGRHLVDALVVIETLHDLRGQADMLGLSLRLLPGGVEQSERFRIDLFALGWDEHSATTRISEKDISGHVVANEHVKKNNRRFYLWFVQFHT